MGKLCRAHERTIKKVDWRYALGIVDFGTVEESHIRAALPLMQAEGVPYYVHAEMPDDVQFQVPPYHRNTSYLPLHRRAPWKCSWALAGQNQAFPRQQSVCGATNQVQALPSACIQDLCAAAAVS